jgi:hypothetical protein
MSAVLPFLGCKPKSLEYSISVAIDPQQSFRSLAFCSAVALSGDTECQRITGGTAQKQL